MRRNCRLLAIVCALIFLLTACGGAGEEPEEEFPSVPDASAEVDEPAPPEEYDAQGIPDEPGTQTPPDESDAPTVPDEPDEPTPPDKPDTSATPDEPDTQITPDEPDAQPVPDEPAPTPDEPDAHILGELTPEVTVSGDAVNVGTLDTVYLPENGKYAPFLVLSADYGGNALLLRRDVLPEFRPFNDYSAVYADSAVDRYLNGEYAQRLDAIADLIQASEIVVTDADALGVSGTAVGTLTRKIFLLSCAETGFNSLVNAGKEGSTLSYFNAPENRTAYRENGPAVSWWLRTPDTYYLSAAYAVGPDGTLGSGNAYNENGVRPALCVPADAEAFPTMDILDGQTVYFLSI
ncbi:MAG: hypothetical protein IJQ81_12970 [Oscillibacter sp.]|nr:hypothetical protein [Oscillibacter sp.]